MTEIEIDPHRLRRIHLANVRAAKDKYVAVISNPIEDQNGDPIENADTWEVPLETFQKALRNGTLDEL